MMRKRSVRLLVAATVAVIAASGAIRASAQRAAWTTSRLVGTRQPPPYKVDVAFEHLKFKQPVTLTNAPNTLRLFVVQLDGKVFSFDEEPDVGSADLFFDVKTVVPNLAAAHGMTFRPRFPHTPYVYLCYVLPGEDPHGSVISRFTVHNGNPPSVDPTIDESRIVLLTADNKQIHLAATDVDAETSLMPD